MKDLQLSKLYASVDCLIASYFGVVYLRKGSPWFEAVFAVSLLISILCLFTAIASQTSTSAIPCVVCVLGILAPHVVLASVVQVGFEQKLEYHQPAIVPSAGKELGHE